jgi:hypothetical protein
MKYILFFIIIISIKWAFEMRKGVKDEKLKRFQYINSLYNILIQ